MSNKDSNSNINSYKQFNEIKLNFINKNDKKIAIIKKSIEKYLKEIKPKIPNYKEFYHKYCENNTYISNNNYNKIKIL